MKKWDRNILILLFLPFCMLTSEMLFFLILDMGLLPTYVWFDVAIILLCLGVMIALPGFRTRSVFAWIVISIQTLLNLANIVIVSATNEIFSFEMLILAGEGLQAFDVSFINVSHVLSAFALLIIQIVTFVFIKHFHQPIRMYKKFNLPLILVLIFLMQFGGSGIYALQAATLDDGDKNSSFYVFESDSYLYENFSSKWECMEKFGTGGFYMRNIQRLFSGRTVSKDIAIQTAKYFAEGKQVKSEVYGVSSGNNVVTILLETMEKFGIDPYFTPNLYKLFYEDGISFTNYRVNNRTNISEGTALIGNYPKENPINQASKNILEVLGNEYEGFTFPRKLNDLGYSTMYVHNNVSWYYNRDKTHGENGVGFQNMLFLEDMDKIEKWVDFNEDPDNEYYVWHNWTMDSEVMEKYVDVMCPTDKLFYTHFSTISSHGAFRERESTKPNYDYLLESKNDPNGLYNKMWDYLYSLGYVKPQSESDLEYFHWYKSAVMDVDKAVKILFDYLKNNNLLQNTTILMFADHNAYYHDLSYVMKDIEISVDSVDTRLYEIPVMIYDEKLKHSLINNVSDKFISDNSIRISDNKNINIDKFSSVYCLLPTMLDVLGIEYNPNFYLNTSVFNTEGYLQIFQPNISGTPYFNDKVYFSFDNIKWQKDGLTEQEILSYKEDALKLYYKNLYIERLYKDPTILKYYNEFKD